MKKRAFGNLYKELFCIANKGKSESNFLCLKIGVSIFSIFVCTAIMVASTFALFYTNVSTQSSTIESAYYTVSVDNAQNGTYTCPLIAEDKHVFVITANGTATTGYCKIQIGDQVYYTDPIYNISPLTLTVQAAKDTVITFMPQWGTLPESLVENRCQNEIIHSTTPSTTYTVEPTAKLADIASHYGVAEADILVYNNLLAVAVIDINGESVLPQLTVGMDLKIPNPTENVEPYKVPYATYTVEAAATLEGISEYYGVSVEDIRLYNGIDAITEGLVLKIPGVPSDTAVYVATVPTQDLTTDNSSKAQDQTEQTEQTEQQPATEELAVLHGTDTDYTLVSLSTITLKNADVLIYKGQQYETAETYQKDLDRRITGVEAVADSNNISGEYFCELLMSTERLLLSLEITENIQNGYLKIIIGEAEYYTAQITNGGYIRLDIVAPIGTKVRFEAYEGVPLADVFFGDDLNDDTDSNGLVIDYTQSASQSTETAEQGEVSAEQTMQGSTASSGETASTEESSEGESSEEQLTEETSGNSSALDGDNSAESEETE